MGSVEQPGSGRALWGEGHEAADRWVPQAEAPLRLQGRVDFLQKMGVLTRRQSCFHPSAVGKVSPQSGRCDEPSVHMHQNREENPFLQVQTLLGTRRALYRGWEPGSLSSHPSSSASSLCCCGRHLMSLCPFPVFKMSRVSIPTSSVFNEMQ